MDFLAIFTPVSEGFENSELNVGRIVLFLFLALGVSFICSLLEAIILSVTWSHIEILNKEEKSSGKSLKRLKEEIDQPLAAILTLNTISHTVGAVWHAATHRVL